MKKETSKCADIHVSNDMFKIKCPQCLENFIASNENHGKWKCPYCGFELKTMVDDIDDLVVL